LEQGLQILKGLIALTPKLNVQFAQKSSFSPSVSWAYPEEIHSINFNGVTENKFSQAFKVYCIFKKYVRICMNTENIHKLLFLKPAL